MNQRKEEKQAMEGSCLCGGIRYSIRGDIAGINYCHCVQCRKASGTAFATNAAVATADFNISQGIDRLASFESSPGKNRYFCSRCGSPIYSQFDDKPDVVYVRIGTIDDDAGLRPDIHIHVASKAPWYEIFDSLPQLQEEEGLTF